MTRGRRTDYHVLLVVGPPGMPKLGAIGGPEDEESLSAAFSIEYGSSPYYDSTGRWQPGYDGLYPLTTGLVAVGAF